MLEMVPVDNVDGGPAAHRAVRPFDGYHVGAKQNSCVRHFLSSGSLRVFDGPRGRLALLLAFRTYRKERII